MLNSLKQFLTSGPFIYSSRVNYRQRNRNTFELLQNYAHKCTLSHLVIVFVQR